MSHVGLSDCRTHTAVLPFHFPGVPRDDQAFLIFESSGGNTRIRGAPECTSDSLQPSAFSRHSTSAALCVCVSLSLLYSVLCVPCSRTNTAAAGHLTTASLQSAMPGGLASWLDDESTSRKSKLPPRTAHFRSKSREASQLASAIDVDATSPDATSARGGRNNLLPASAGKPAWDPFSSSSARVNAREDAFARLRQGAAAAKQQPATSTTAASTPSPPSWRRESSPPSSTWDPFAGTADGKENRGNAFSKLLATPCQQHSSHKGRGLVGGGSGKRTKLSARTAAVAGGLGGTASEAEAATRFCECPVCGKRVRSSWVCVPRAAAVDLVVQHIFSTTRAPIKFETYHVPTDVITL